MPGGLFCLQSGERFVGKAMTIAAGRVQQPCATVSLWISARARIAIFGILRWEDWSRWVRIRRERNGMPENEGGSGTMVSARAFFIGGKGVPASILCVVNPESNRYMMPV